MSEASEYAITPIADGDRIIPVPASVLYGLIGRVEELEAAARALREQLGALTVEAYVASESTREVPADSPPAAIHGSGATAFELLSQLASEVERPFTEIDAEARARGELVETIQAKAAPFAAAFTREMLSRVPLTDTDRKKLPPCPSPERSPAEYARYIKRYGKPIKWDEKDGLTTHQFSLMYLDEELPELTRFGIDTKKKVAGITGTDLHMNTVEFVFAHSSLVSLSLSHGINLGSQPKPLRFISDDYDVVVKLGAELSITQRSFTEKRPTTFIYTASQQSFIDATHTKPGTVCSPIPVSACMRQIDKILACVPGQPV